MDVESAICRVTTEGNGDVKCKICQGVSLGEVLSTA